MNWQAEIGSRGGTIFAGLANSFLIGIGAALIGMTLGTLAGYGLARFRYRGWRNRDISLYFLSQRFLPPAATILPFFYFAQRLHLLDTRLILIIANATFTMPFSVLLMRDAIKSIPVELEEAARVDGANSLTILARVALPLAAPTLIAAGIISFAFTWNEFLFAFVLSYSKAVPMSVVIAGTQDVMGVQFWYVSTRLLLAILPPAIVVLMTSPSSSGRKARAHAGVRGAVGSSSRSRRRFAHMAWTISTKWTSAKEESKRCTFLQFS